MNKKIAVIAFSLAFLCFVILCGLFVLGRKPGMEKESPQDDRKQDFGELSVTFLSVGRADSALVSCNGMYMLIDGADRSDASYISRAIRQSGAKKLDYVICTHPHDDHIGALLYIVGEFEVGRIFCADVPYGDELFKDLLFQAEKKGIETEHPERGETLSLGDAYVVFLSSGKVFEKENDMSLILKIFHGENTFLFMADAGLEAENELMSDGISVSCDLLKVGHHGSIESTGKEFLSKSSPEYAVISVGENSIEHPSDLVVDRLIEQGIRLFRTDERGDITAISDGKSISFKFQKE